MDKYYSGIGRQIVQFCICYALFMSQITGDKDKKGQGNVNKKLVYPADDVDKSMCRDDQPEYLPEVKDLMKKMAKELGYGEYDICQNLPWYQIHRSLEVILGPDNDTKYLGAKSLNRTVNITKMVIDLHKMDLAAGFFRQLTQNTSKEYTELNKQNEADAMDKVVLMKIESLRPKRRINGSKIKALRKNFTRILNSAPANMRPGNRAKNKLIGCHYDPNVIQYKGERILTPGSKELAKTYESSMVTYGETSREKKIITSDILPTTRTLQPTTAPMGTVGKKKVTKSSSKQRRRWKRRYIDTNENNEMFSLSSLKSLVNTYKENDNQSNSAEQEDVGLLEMLVRYIRNRLMLF